MHTGGGLISCIRYYGDETYVPAKVEYLRQLLQARVPAGKTLRVKLDRLDTIEYCDNTANRGAAAAAARTGAPYIVPTDVPVRRQRLIQVTGEVEWQAIRCEAPFDYSALPVPFPQMPAYNTEYVVLFKRAFEEIADEIGTAP